MHKRKLQVDIYFLTNQMAADGTCAETNLEDAPFLRANTQIIKDNRKGCLIMRQPFS